MTTTVKSILKILEVQNLPFFKTLSQALNLDSYEILHFLKAEIYQIAKTAILDLLDSPKLISRKIRVIEKYLNFHTVLY